MSDSLSQVTVIGRPQPRTWADYRQGCLDNYGGGHRSDGHLEAFRHGMETVFNLLEAEFPPAEQCKAATDLIFALKECCAAQKRHRWHTNSDEADCWENARKSLWPFIGK